MVQIKCGWCGEEFDVNVTIGRISGCRSLVKCPKCCNLLPSSRKIPTGNVVGRKHIHWEYEEGDTAC